MTLVKLLALALPLFTPQGTNPAPTATLKFSKPTAPPGSQVRATLVLTFAPDLHAFPYPPADDTQIPLKIEAWPESKYKLVKVLYPKGTPMMVAGSEKPTPVYAGTVKIPVVLRAPAKPGAARVMLRVSYQQCNETSCFAPSELLVDTRHKVAAVKKSK